MQLPILRECENMVLKIKAIEFGLEPKDNISSVTERVPSYPLRRLGTHNLEDHQPVSQTIYHLLVQSIGNYSRPDL